MASSGEWCRETDSSTGRAYFWHPTTGAARWTLDDSESVRFDQAMRASDPAKGLLHYQNRLKKAVRLVKFPRIEKFRRKIAKYRAIVSPPPPPTAKKRKIGTKGGTSRFTGVHWCSDRKQGKQWRAFVAIRTAEGRKTITIGHYDDEEVAGHEYNAYVRRHGLGNKLNEVDANGKLVPKAKPTSRFWGVYWNKRSSKWRAEYLDDSKPRAKSCHVGYFADEEVAALAYNEAVIAADLQHLRPVNRVDASGRPIPKDQD